MKEYIRWEAHSARKKHRTFILPKPVREKLLCVTWHNQCQTSEALSASAKKISLPIVKSWSVSKHVASRSLSFSRRCFREHCVNRFMALDVFKDRNATTFKCQRAQTMLSFEMSGTVNPAAHSHNPGRPISSTLQLCYENQPDNAVQINKSNHYLF
jgi:hypothetical protein